MNTQGQPKHFDHFEQYVVERQLINPNPYLDERYLLKFENGYAASVIRGGDTYGGAEGLWEVMLLKCSTDSDGSCTYLRKSRNLETNKTLHGWLTERDLYNKLEEFKNIPPHNEG